jgi:hypothetical protein
VRINEILGVVTINREEWNGQLKYLSTYDLNLRMSMLTATVSASFSSPLYKIWLYITHLV